MLGMLYCITPVHNGNIFWHLRNGLDILETGEIRTADPFTWTREGVYWIQHEWLAETIMAASWSGLGEAGPVFLKALFIGLGIFFTAKAAVRNGGDPPFVFLFGAMWLTLAQPRWIARPHFFSIFFFSLFLYILSLKIEKPLKLALFLLPLQILWVNMHAGFVMGIFLSAVPAMHRFFTGRFRELPGWIIPPVFLALASGLHPNGFRTLEYLPSFLSQPLYKESIREWWSPFDSRYAPEKAISKTAILFISFTVITSLLLIFKRKRLEAGRMAALVILTLSTAFAARNGELLAPAMLAWIPAMLDLKIPRQAVPAAFLLLASAPFIYGVPREIGPPRQLGAGVDWSAYPVELADIIEGHPALMKNSVLFNTNEISGYLEFRFGEDLPLFLDGRCLLFPEDFHKDYLVLSVANSRAAMAQQYELFNKYGFDLLIYSNLQEGSSVYLAAMLPEFRLFHIDGLVAAYASKELLSESGADSLAFRYFDPLTPSVLLSGNIYMFPANAVRDLRRAENIYFEHAAGSIADALEFRDDTTAAITENTLQGAAEHTLNCWKSCRENDLESAALYAELSGDTDLQTAVDYLMGSWPENGMSMFGIRHSTMRTDANIHLAQITALWITGQSQKALALAEENLHGLNAWGTAQCAVFHSLAGNTERALELTDKALAMAHSPMVMHRTAMVYAAVEDWKTAETNCREALRLSPDLTEARLLLADCLWESEEIQEAASEYKRLQESGLRLPDYAIHRLEFILSLTR